MQEKTIANWVKIELIINMCQYLTLACNLILFPKIPPFCTPQVLLLCVKKCSPPLHNYSEIDGIVLHNDFDTNVMFFSMSNHLFPCSTVC